MGFDDWHVVEDVEEWKRDWPTEEGTYIVSYRDEVGHPYRMLAEWVKDVEYYTMEFAERHHAGFMYWTPTVIGMRLNELKRITAWMPAPEAYG